VNYQTIKAMVLAGESPSVDSIDAAIRAQIVAVATYANSVAKHSAKLLAADAHPFPLPDDQAGRAARRVLAFDAEMSRLLRLHVWRELAVNSFATAPAGSA